MDIKSKGKDRTGRNDNGYGSEAITEQEKIEYLVGACLLVLRRYLRASPFGGRKPRSIGQFG